MAKKIETMMEQEQFKIEAPYLQVYKATIAGMIPMYRTRDLAKAMRYIKQETPSIGPLHLYAVTDVPLVTEIKHNDMPLK